jgi:hypothetical protein
MLFWSLLVSASGQIKMRKRSPPSRSICPISKSSKEDNEAGELDEAEEVATVIFPADKDATLLLYPGKKRSTSQRRI